MANLVRDLLCEHLVNGETDRIYRFLISRRFTVSKANAFLEVAAWRENVTNRKQLWAFLEDAEKWHADAMRLMCEMNPCAAMAIFSWAVHRDTEGSESLGRDIDSSFTMLRREGHTRALAQKIQPEFLEVPRTNVNGFEIARGTYDPMVFAALVLGANAASACVIGDLVLHSDAATGRYAIKALRALPNIADFARDELLREYEDICDSAPSRPRVIRAVSPGYPTPHSLVRVAGASALTRFFLFDDEHAFVPPAQTSAASIPAKPVHIIETPRATRARLREEYKRNRGRRSLHISDDSEAPKALDLCSGTGTQSREESASPCAQRRRKWAALNVVCGTDVPGGDDPTFGPEELLEVQWC
jgi:hypothetical protein